MLIFVLSYLGGILTILSPCVLPVLPFVFAGSDRPFRRSGLPILFGMAATFTLLASLAAVGGAWLIRLNQYGQYAAMALLLAMGAALIFPTLSEYLMRPFVTLGGRLQQQADRQSSVAGSLLLGIAIGFLWAPCAGPILGLALAGAALNGANLYSAALLLAFAAGAATSLALALLAGGRFLTLMRRSLGTEEWLRRALGIAVVLGVAIIALGWDTRLLSQFTPINTAGTEQRLIDRLNRPSEASKPAAATMPSLAGATRWINSPPLSPEMLRGKVVLVDFWTYSCINCLRTLPYLKAWAHKYRDQGLVIIGVHAPEFAFEKDPSNVDVAVRDLGLDYPIAMDNEYAIWNAYHNEYWPAHYLIDTQGVIRETHFGEGGYRQTEAMIQKLLSEAGRTVAAGQLVQATGTGATAAATNLPRSPETYLGYARAENLASPEPVRRDEVARYSMPARLQTDQWALLGSWQVLGESVNSQMPEAAIGYRFQGRDLHLVMASKKPVRFRVFLDGAAPGIDHGADIDEAGFGVIREQRLYHLIRQRGTVKERTFRIEFLDQGAQAFAFTFG